MKQDTLIIITAKVLDYLREEWTKLVSIAVGVILIIAVSLFILSGMERSEINAYDIAIKASLDNAPEAMDLMTKYVNKYGGSKRAASVLINLGNHYYSIKDYDSAEIYYKKYIEKFSDDPLYGFNAYNGLGGIYEEKGEFEKAASLYEEYISKYKNAVFSPLMSLSAGKAYFYSGNKNAALRNFNRVVDSFKDSQEKQEAQFYIDMITAGKDV